MSERIVTSWANVKSMADLKTLSLQYLEVDDYYYIYAVDGIFSLEHRMMITSPPSSDQTDFEANYKLFGNRPLKVRSTSSLGGDDYAANFRAHEFQFTKNSTTTINWKVDAAQTVYLKGGIVFAQNAEIGDYFSVYVVDVDGLYAPPGTVLADYVKKWYVHPTIALEAGDSSIGSLYPGLYMRVVYTSIGTVNDPKLFVNLISFKAL